jgi:hypothetical protein
MASFYRLLKAIATNAVISELSFLYTLNFVIKSEVITSIPISITNYTQHDYIMSERCDLQEEGCLL